MNRALPDLSVAIGPRALRDLIAGVVLAAVLTIFSPAFGASYYLSPDGDDAADGLSPLSAWRTFDRANAQALQSGDRLLFESGRIFTRPGADATNRAVNSGFEAGLADWVPFAVNGVVTLNTNPAHVRTGTASLSINGSVAAWNGAFQSLPASIAQPGDSLVLRFFAKRDPASPNNSNWRAAGIDFKKNGVNAAQGTNILTRATTSFVEIVVVATAPADFEAVEIWFMEGDGGGTYYVDDITLTNAGRGLLIRNDDSGTPLAPVVIGSYGVGSPPVIEAGPATALEIESAGGIRVENLHFRGIPSNPLHSRGSGLLIKNTRTDGTDYDYLRFHNLIVEGFRYGMRFEAYSQPNYSGFRDIEIANCTVRFGIGAAIETRHTYNQNAAITDANYPYQNVVVRDCLIHDIYGENPQEDGGSGHGVLLGGVVDGVVERCIARHGARDAGPSSNNGSAYGIWAWDSRRLLFQDNIVYEYYKGLPTYDGGGLDFDGGVRDSVMQYNYSYNNQGPGYLVAEFNNNSSALRRNANNIIRYNISWNDNRTAGMGAIHFWTASHGGINNIHVHNNTVWTTRGSGNNAGLMFQQGGVATNLRILNNIFIVSGTSAVSLMRCGTNVPTGLTWNNNLWWNAGPAFAMQWNNVTHNSLAAWRTASSQGVQDIHADPRLEAPATLVALQNPSLLPTLTGFHPRSDSPVINAGAGFAGTGLQNPGTDFYGTSLPQGSAPEIGAAERPSSVFGAWVLRQPGLMILPSEQRSATADPDADGAGNLMEFVLGGNPLAAAPLPQAPVLGLENNRLTLTFTPAVVSNLRFFVEGSSDLNTWPDVVEISNFLSVGVPFTYQDTVNLPGIPRRFVRLRIVVQE